MIKPTSGPTKPYVFLIKRISSETPSQVMRNSRFFYRMLCCISDDRGINSKYKSKQNVQHVTPVKTHGFRARELRPRGFQQRVGYKTPIKEKHLVYRENYKRISSETPSQIMRKSRFFIACYVASATIEA